MSEFTSKMDTSSVEALARDFVKKYGPGVTMGLLKAGQAMRPAIVKNVRTILNNHPEYSTGQLANSWEAGAVYFSGTDEASIDVFSPLPYAMIHDHGGTIYPKKAKALAIPNRDSKFFSGSNKDFPSPSLLTPDKHALLWLDKKTGTLKDDKGQVAYFLKRSVKMPARNYVRYAVEEAGPEVEIVFREAIAEVIEGSE